jgi:N-methylhydantoinase B
MIDIHTIGAGGGSIVRVSDDVTLTVGPESASAVPGAVCYARGRVVCGTMIPLFGNLMPAIFEQYPAKTMRAGDLYWYNDCHGSRGGVSHSPDMVFAAPVFHRGRLLAFSQTWGHFWDIGGLRAGSISPDATEIFHEGIIVPPIRIYREGVLNDEAFRVFLRNSRFPDILQGDIRAVLAGCRLGERSPQPPPPLV